MIPLRAFPAAGRDSRTCSNMYHGRRRFVSALGRLASASVPRKTGAVIYTRTRAWPHRLRHRPKPYMPPMWPESRSCSSSIRTRSPLGSVHRRPKSPRGSSAAGRCHAPGRTPRGSSRLRLDASRASISAQMCGDFGRCRGLPKRNSLERLGSIERPWCNGRQATEFQPGGASSRFGNSSRGYSSTLPTRACVNARVAERSTRATRGSFTETTPLPTVSTPFVGAAGREPARRIGCADTGRFSEAMAGGEWLQVRSIETLKGRGAQRRLRRSLRPRRRVLPVLNDMVGSPDSKLCENAHPD
jgi:hypothetical protein